MAKIDFSSETVMKVAHLARLELTAEETAKFSSQLTKILDYVEKLNSLDTSKVEPMTQVHDVETPLREDETRPSPGAAAILDSAPEQVFDNYKVPQVIATKGKDEA